uniref:2-aminoadipate transaminase n=1 Tax=uncultured organism TaxID=155900 RepID=A0A7L9QCJ2_9ZZZZ|nr:2-aminoadipate transaminase [uncultured organism]
MPGRAWCNRRNVSGLISGTRTPDVASALADWKRGHGPLLARLAGALEAAILRGVIPAGTRLPSERDLARELVLSRSTVVAAYDRLKAEGRIHTLRGSGTYAGPAPSERDPFSAGHLLSIVDNRELPRQTVEFTIAALPGSREIAPAAARLAAKLGPMSERTPGYLPLGLSSLRREIAQIYTRRGLPTDPEQIIVTSGAQQAIALVAQLFRGSRVAMEDPTNPASLDAFRAAGAEISAVAVDGDGARVDDLDRIPPGEQPRAVYVASTFNNPTGTAISLARRQKLAALSRSEGWTIIEDETLCDISLHDAPLPPAIAALDPAAAVYSIGSACKLFWGGLRIGWVRGSGDLATRLAPLKIVADLGTSLVGQALCAELLPLRDRVRAERREQLQLRYGTLADALARSLPSWTWNEPRGGSSLWIELPYGDSASFAQDASRAGVTLAPGAAFSSTERHARRLRVPFVLDPDILRAGVDRLARVWEAYAPRVTTLPLDAVV